MNSDRPVPPYFPDILPEEGYSLGARRLLASAMQSWVFGGMGSFNDLGYQDGETNDEYERIADSLYDSVSTAILAAVNSVGGQSPQSRLS